MTFGPIPNIPPRMKDEARARWVSREAAIREALAAGKSPQEIAAGYGVTFDGMRDALAKYLGLRLGKKGLLQ